jgi:hypothetical protein
MAAQQRIDYERIEPGWRAGILSPAQLAEAYTLDTGTAVSRVAIIKHFQRLGVPRDLKAKIQAKADAMVQQAMVTGKVTTATTVTTGKIIDHTATEQVRVRLAHQAGAARMHKLVVKLTAELDRQTAKTAGLKDRASTAKALIDAFGRLVAIERETYGISGATSAPPSAPPTVDDSEARRQDFYDRFRAIVAQNSGVPK